MPHDAAADCWEASGAELTKEGGEVSTSKIVSAIHRKVVLYSSNLSYARSPLQQHEKAQKIPKTKQREVVWLELRVV